jgi:hypothetical protein
MILETLQANYIPVKDIIVTHPEEKISSLEGVIDHVKTREGYFIATLAGISYGTKTGWQRIQRDDDGQISKKLTDSKDLYGIFTGKNLCDLAAISLAAGLKKKTTGINISVVSLSANLNMEPNALDSDRLGLHFLVEIQDEVTKEVRYFDPTYGQIDHTTTRTISVFTKEELTQKYSNKGISPKLETVSDEEIDAVKQDLQIFYFSGSDFKQLYQTML